MTLSLFMSLHVDGGEEDGEQAIEHDDKEDGLYDRCRGFAAEGFGAALDREPLRTGDDADDERHERRLDHADLEMRQRDGFAQSADVDLRAHAAVEPSD